MMRWTHHVLLVLILGAGLMAVTAVQADDDDGPPIAAPQWVFTEHGVTYVQLDEATQQAIGLQTKTLKNTPYQQRFQAYGQVIDLSPLLADYQQLANAQAKVSRFQAQLAASHAEYQRLLGLYKQRHNVSKKEVQGARAAWRSDRASAKAATASRSGTAHQIEAQWGPVIAGWLIEDKPAFEKLSKDKTRLLRLTLPLGQTLANPPSTARLLLDGGTTPTVSVVSPAPRVEPDLQGQSYYFLATSRLEDLRYGLRVTASIPYGPQRHGVVVPKAAVVWLQGSAWAYIKTDNNRFLRQPIRTDRPVPGGWFQASGLSAGKTVVTQGAALLSSVQALASAPQASGGD
ncbi:MAG: hypothetical protein PF501_20630 [Salinisphaera sp.]|jgi:hypothetical protein|nr:hypothetical protein [Salinisphaera sp.]